MDTARVRLVISGRVQGVWFRQSTAQEAERLGVSGWVRNMPNGGVEAVFEGPPDHVECAVEWAHRGPERAHVTEVERFTEAPTGGTGFQIR